MIATVWDLAAEHGITFLAGLIVGFVLTSRYRIVRINGRSNMTETPERPDEDVPEVPPSEQGEPDHDGDDRPEPEEEGSDERLSEEARRKAEREDDDGR